MITYTIYIGGEVFETFVKLPQWAFVWKVGQRIYRHKAGAPVTLEIKSIKRNDKNVDITVEAVQ